MHSFILARAGCHEMAIGLLKAPAEIDQQKNADHQ